MSVNLGSAHGTIVLDSSGAVRGIEQATGSLLKFHGASLNVAQAIGSVGQSMLLAGAAVGAGLGAGLGIAINKAQNFNQQMKNVQAISQASGQEFEDLRLLALDLGQSTIFTAQQVGQAMEELAKAGISTADIMGGATAGALSLATAGGLDLAEAATIASVAINTFNLDGTEMNHVADLFASAANASSIEVRDLQLSLRQAGQVSKQFGLSLDDTIAVLASFGAEGLKASDAGTSLRTFLLSTVNPTKKAQKAMNEYGISFFDVNGEFKDLDQIAQNLQDSLSGLTQEQRSATLELIFGRDAIRASNILFEQGAAGVEHWQNVVSQTGAAAKVASTRLDTLKGDVEQMTGAFETSGIQIGTAFDPALRKIVQTITDVVQAFNNASRTSGIFETISKTIVSSLNRAATVITPFAKGIGRIFEGFKTGDFTFAFGPMLDAFRAAFGDDSVALAVRFANGVIDVARTVRDSAITIQQALKGEWWGGQNEAVGKFVRTIGRGVQLARDSVLTIKEALAGNWFGGEDSGIQPVVRFIGRFVQLARDAFLTIKQVLAGEWVPSDAIQPVVNIIGQVASVIVNAAHVIRDAWPQISSGAGSAFGAISHFIMDVALPALSDFLTWVNVNLPAIAAAVTAFVATWQTLSTIGTIVSVAAAVAFAALNPLATLFIVLSAAAGAFAAAWATNWNGIRDSSKGAVDEIKSTFESSIVPAFDRVVAFITGTVVPAFREFAKPLLDNLPQVAEFIGSFITSFAGLSTAVGGVAAVFGAIAAAANPVTLVIAAISLAVAALATAWINDWGNIRQTVADGAREVSSFVTGVLIPALQGLAIYVTSVVIPAIVGLYVILREAGVFDALGTALHGVNEALQSLTKFVQEHEAAQNVLKGVLTAIIVLWGLNQVAAAAAAVSTAAYAVAAAAAATGAGLLATAIGLINVAMAVAPWVAAAGFILALGVAFVEASKHSDEFSNHVQQASDAIQRAVTTKSWTEFFRSIYQGFDNASKAAADFAAEVNASLTGVPTEQKKQEINVVDPTQGMPPSMLGVYTKALQDYHNAAGPVIDDAAKLNAQFTGLGGAMTSGAVAVSPTSFRDTALALQDMSIYGSSAQTLMNDLAGATLGFSLALDGANAAIRNFGTETGYLQGLLNTQQTEWNELQIAIAKNGGPTQQQATRVIELADSMTFLHQKIQDNKVGMQEATTTAVNSFKGWKDAQKAVDDATASAKAAIGKIPAAPTAAAPAAPVALPPVSVPVQVTGAADTGLTIDQIKTKLTDLNNSEATVKVTVSDVATLTVDQIKATLTEMNSTTATPVVNATDNASPTLNAIKNTLTEMNSGFYAPTISVNDAASLTIQQIKDTLTEMNSSSYAPTVTINDQASGPLSNITGAMNALDGRNIGLTASVDIGGALNAISTLRANMPSSPADEGPFKTLPDWGVVMESLSPALDKSVKDTEKGVGAIAGAIDTGMTEAAQAAAKGSAEVLSAISGAVKGGVEASAALRSFRAPTKAILDAFMTTTREMVSQFAEMSGMLGEDGGKAVGEFAGNMNSVFGALKSAMDLFTGLKTFTRPTEHAIRQFFDTTILVVKDLNEAAAMMDIEGIISASVWAESMGKVFTSIKDGAAALQSLIRFTRPSEYAISQFKFATEFLVKSLGESAATMDEDFVKHAADFADAAGKALATLKPGIEGLNALRTFVRPTNFIIGEFKFAVEHLVKSFGDSAQLLSDDFMKRAGDFADAAGKGLALLEPGIKGFNALGTFVRPSNVAIGEFKFAVEHLVKSFGDSAALLSEDFLSHANDFSETAGKAVDVLGTGAEAFTKLGDFEAPPATAVLAFRDSVTLVVKAFGEVAATMSEEFLTSVSTFSDTASKAVGLVGSGVDALAKLTEQTFRAPAEADVRNFADSVRRVVIAIGDAAATIKTEAVTAAGNFSDDAQKVVQLVGAGLEAFLKFSDFQPPSEGQINQLKNVVIAVVHAVADASKTIDSDLATAAAEFADKAGSAVNLIGSAIQAFTVDTSIDKAGNPKETHQFISGPEIDTLVGVIRYAVDQLIGLSTRYDKGSLERMSQFAKAVQDGFSAIKSAQDVAQTVKKDTEDAKPVDPGAVIAGVLAQFTSGVGQLTQLVNVATQYQQQAAKVKSLMAQAFNDIYSAIPGMDPAAGGGAGNLLANGGTITFNSRIEVVHTHSPITFQMMGENGPWIVRSLQVDDASRAEVSAMVADTIMAANPQPAAGGP